MVELTPGDVYVLMTTKETCEVMGEVRNGTALIQYCFTTPNAASGGATTDLDALSTMTKQGASGQGPASWEPENHDGWDHHGQSRYQNDLLVNAGILIQVCETNRSECSNSRILE